MDCSRLLQLDVGLLALESPVEKIDVWVVSVLDIDEELMATVVRDVDEVFIADVEVQPQDFLIVAVAFVVHSVALWNMILAYDPLPLLFAQNGLLVAGEELVQKQTGQRLEGLRVAALVLFAHLRHSCV